MITTPQPATGKKVSFPHHSGKFIQGTIVRIIRRGLSNLPDLYLINAGDFNTMKTAGTFRTLR